MATITVKIPDPTEERLRRQAQAAGKPVEQFVREVLEAQAAPAKTLLKISGSAHQRFLDSGMTEEELAERLEQEDHAARGVPYDE
jgi:plasmid stability protein